jgi:hypothetical protein
MMLTTTSSKGCTYNRRVEAVFQRVRTAVFRQQLEIGGDAVPACAPYSDESNTNKSDNCSF